MELRFIKKVHPPKVTHHSASYLWEVLIICIKCKVIALVDHREIAVEFCDNRYR